jgi:hypothetical protein
MRTSTLLLFTCFLFLPVSSNKVESSTVIKNGMEEVRTQLIELESVAKEDKIIQDYLKTLRVGKPKDNLTMLDRFPRDLRRLIHDSCTVLEINEKDFYKLVHFESQGNTKARNKHSKATGYIQFTVETANKYGTSIDKLYNMSPEEQLSYTFRYLNNANKRRKFNGTYDDLYLAVFSPSSRGKRGDHIIADTTTKNGKNAVLWNSQFDINGDNIITLSELQKYNQKQQ